MITPSRTSRRLVPGAAVLLLGLTLSGCAAPTDTTPSEAASTIDPGPECGLGNGTVATGEPVKLGALSLDVPGLSYTEAADSARAYFDCVNDNGGINGRPIEYTVYKDALDPAQSNSFTRQLIDEDKVLGIVGGLNAMDCLANNEIYQEKGFYVIGIASAPQCFSVSNYSPINVAGPTLLPAAQVAVDQGATKVVTVLNAAPGVELNATMVGEWAESVGVEYANVTENVPVVDANGLALRLAEEAGPGGTVILTFTADQALQVFRAAEQQGLIDQVKWACGSACADDDLASQLGSVWDGKLSVISDFALPTSDGADATLYRSVMSEYAPDVRVNAVGINGFLSARMAVDALLNLPEDQLTQEGVNSAFRSISKYTTDLLCKPWSFGSGDYHMSNNTVVGLTPENGRFVVRESCFDMAAVPSNHLDEIRAGL